MERQDSRGGCNSLGFHSVSLACLRRMLVCRQIISGVEYLPPEHGELYTATSSLRTCCWTPKGTSRIADFGLSNVMRDGHFLETSLREPQPRSARKALRLLRPPGPWSPRARISLFVLFLCPARGFALGGADPEHAARTKTRGWGK